MIVVGLCGYGGVGKDEVGRLLCEDHGFLRLAKGDLIRHAAMRIDPWVRLSWDAEGGSFADRLSNVVTKYDWGQAQKFPDVRRFLQNLADIPVEVVGVDFWTDALWRQIRQAEAEGFKKIVLTRMSLPSEADRLWAEGPNVLVRVIRPGHGPLNDHPNEVSLDEVDPDFMIVNDGTVFDLALKVKNFVADLGSHL